MLVHTALPRDLMGPIPAPVSPTSERSLRELRTLVAFFSAHASTIAPMIRPNPDERRYERLLLDDTVEVWLIAWATGQWTRRHDHGGALGALGVLQGAVVEEQSTSARTLRQGDTAVFHRKTIHRVGNDRHEPAVTVHAYSPPLLPLQYHGTAAASAVPAFA
jgi:quercetin dioxygenase-like cupin family protein